jgi:hypothetical protein
MDLIKVEPNSDGEEDPVSSDHEEELINMNTVVLPVTVPLLKVESQMSSFRIETS